jgi:pyruvate dehydrogenase E1 component alpha subunit
MWAEWGAKDPIRRLETLMIDRGWTDAEQIDRGWAAIRQTADQAIEWAERSPFPDPATLRDNVYEERA